MLVSIIFAFFADELNDILYSNTLLNQILVYKCRCSVQIFSMGNVVDIIIPDAEIYPFCFEQRLDTG